MILWFHLGGEAHICIEKKGSPLSYPTLPGGGLALSHLSWKRRTPGHPLTLSTTAQTPPTRAWGEPAAGAPSQRWFAPTRTTCVGQISTNSCAHFNLETSQVLQGTHPSQGQPSDLGWFRGLQKRRQNFLHPGFLFFCYFPFRATEGSKWICTFIFYWTSKLVMRLSKPCETKMTTKTLVPGVS